MILYAFLIIAIFTILILVDMPLLLNVKQRTKTMVVYFILIGLGMTISILLTIGLIPTSPAVLIEHMIKFIIPGD